MSKGVICLTRSFYDNPDIYDLAHTEKIDEMLKEYYKNIFKDKDIKTIHDCSFGTGHISIVLAKMGYKVSGSDISERMLEKAEENIRRQGLSIELFQSDFRKLTDKINGTYDCVMSTGNSLAHVNNEDAGKTIYEMSRLVRDNGYIYIDTRNWDRILNTKQRFYYYNPFFKDGERINLTQVWDHNDDGTVTFNFLYSYEKENRILRHEEFQELYYPLKKETIESFLRECGFRNIEIHNFGNPKITGFGDMEWYSIIAEKQAHREK